MHPEIRKQWQALAAPELVELSEIVSDPVRLDEQSGHTVTTEAEIIVFGLERSLLGVLQFSYRAYEALIERITEFPPELLDRTRAEIPQDTVSFIPYSARPDSYMWFAKQAFDIPNRQAYAFFQKRYFNFHNVHVYNDEQRPLA